MHPQHLPEDVIGVILHGTFAAIDHMHSNNVIHRDIKGANILFTRRFEVKLVDFGVCALLQEQSQKRDTAIGTPYWMAPEVITCQLDTEGHSAYNAKADIWSAGITAIEIAEGDPPLASEGMCACVWRVCIFMCVCSV